MWLGLARSNDFEAAQSTPYLARSWKPRALSLAPKLAPLKAAVFPLVKKDGMPEVAEKLHNELRAASMPSFYDAAGSIGRRYRRQDEAGTPWCITIDGQTLEDQTVTIRDRDTLTQERVALDRVRSWIRERLDG